VRFQIRDSGFRGSSLSRDISLGGIQLFPSEFLPVNKNILLEIFLDNMPTKVINSIARVVWSKQQPYADRYRVGLEFSEISDEAKNVIFEYIYSKTYSPS
jgi:c-di-GMP-binding flagellar brake protein YcgR